MKRILLTGGGGQLGLALQRLDWGELVQLERPSREALDITSRASIAALFERSRYDLVINAAAYTAVDKAESEVSEAFAINGLGPALLAEASARAGAPMIQISTDYVFAGDKQAPYVEDDPVAPLGVYGASKLAGELAVRHGNPRSVVLRTAWVLSPFRTNFLRTMLRLSESRPHLSVVADQIGCPTSALDLAGAIQKIVEIQLARPDAPSGIYHFVNQGSASWCDLANAIFELASPGQPRTIAQPITTDQYPTAARRPANSRLSTAKIERDFGVQARPWREAVAEILTELSKPAARESHHP